jgi:hypothetical protein
VASDSDDSKIEFARKQLGMEICPTAKIDTLNADVYAPCALGEILTDAAVERMRCRRQRQRQESDRARGAQGIQFQRVVSIPRQSAPYGCTGETIVNSVLVMHAEKH